MVAHVEILAVKYTSSGQLTDVLKFEIINITSWWFEYGAMDSFQVFTYAARILELPST